MAFDLYNVPVHVPDNYIGSYVGLFYAPPKFGKSSFVNEFGNVLFLAFEVGYKALEGVRPVIIPDWKWFVKNIVDEAEKGAKEGKELPYDTICCDTADKMIQLCRDFVMKKHGIEHESELEWGKGYAFVTEEFERQINRLVKLGLGVWFVAHSETKIFKPKNAPEYTKIYPTLPKGSRQALLELCDFIVYGDTVTEMVDDEPVRKRKIFLRDTELFEAGSRLKCMSAELDFGNDAKEGFDNFMADFDQAFFKQYGKRARGFGDNPPAEPTKEKTKDKTTKTTKTTKTKKEEVKKEDTPPPTPEPTPEKKEKVEKETPPEIKEETPKVELTLEQAKTKIGEIFSNMYKNKEKTANELVELCEKHTGVQGASKIDNLDKALALLEAIS